MKRNERRRGGPAQHHLAGLPAADLAGAQADPTVRALDHGVETKHRVKVGDKRVTVNISARPSRKLVAAGILALQPLGLFLDPRHPFRGRQPKAARRGAFTWSFNSSGK